MSALVFALSVTGMTCGGCVASVRRIVETVRGTEVAECEVGYVVFRAPSTDQEKQVCNALIDAGFGILEQAPKG
jgi:copper chaperone CopZ